MGTVIRKWLERLINVEAECCVYILDYERFNWLLTHVLLHFKNDTASKPLDYKFENVWVKGMFYEYGVEYTVHVYKILGATCAIKIKGDAATWIFANGAAL